MGLNKRGGRCGWILAAAVVAGLGTVARAATYYVDFDGGKDNAAGTAADAAWRHCPGDKAATGAAKAAALAAGDMVLFKGGVMYRGTVTIKAPGAEGKPITFEGGSEQKFGSGAAVIEGAEALTGWKACKSAAECGGNVNWKNIYVAYAPAATQLWSVNLCEGPEFLKLAQDPNVEDAFYQEEVRSFMPTTEPIPHRVSDVTATAGKGMKINGMRPMFMVVDGAVGTSAIFEPMTGSEVTIKLPAEKTVVSVGIGQGTGYQAGRDFVFLSGGKEIFSGTLKEDAKGKIQKFDLPAPVAIQDLTLKFTSAWPHKGDFGAVSEVQAYDAKGVNVLKASTHMEYVKADYFTQSDPHYWDGAYFAVMAKPNWMHYQKVTGYVPAEHKIEFAAMDEPLYDPKVHPETARFSMFNAMKILDQPGEYCYSETPEADGTHKVWLWPRKGGEGKGPEAITCSVRKNGFILEGANYVTIENLKFEKQSGESCSAIDASKVSHLVIQKNEITQLCAGLKRTGAVLVRDGEDGLIDGNRISLNRRMQAIMASRFNNGVASNNDLHKNGGTAIDYYDCHHSKLLKNVVTENNGVHANGLTMYLGCSDILVEGNRVTDSNVCLTMQDGSDIVVRYNVFDGHGVMPSIGLWAGKPLKNITIENNVCAHAAPHHEWNAAIFGGNKGASGYVIRNNIIDGLGGESFPADTVFSHNLYTQPGPWRNTTKKALGPGEIAEPDLAKIFVDAGKLDFHLKAGSPAIDAGVDVGLTRDLAGNKVPTGKGVDIGVYEYQR